MEPASTLAPGREAELRRFRRLADLFDRAFRVPGTSWRFGLDALIGLVPGVGDVAGAVFALYGVWTAHRVGAPLVILARMVANVAFDLLIGLVPGAGDAADFLFAAHSRNRGLLEAWLADPERAARRSRVVLIGVPAVTLLLLVVTVVMAVWMIVACVQWLVGAG